MDASDAIIGFGPVLAMTVTDALDEDAMLRRTADIRLLSERFGFIKAVRIRDDARSPGAFALAACVVSENWDGTVLLESEVPESLHAALIPLSERKTVILNVNLNNFDSHSIIAYMTGSAVALQAEKPEDLMDLASKAGEMGLEYVLDPMAMNTKDSLESNIDLRRLSETVPEAGRPIMTRSWSGEYALTMSAVSVLSGGSLMVVDDLDADSLETLGRVIETSGAGLNED